VSGPRWGSAALRGLRGVLVDVAPLRASVGFRWLFGGQTGALLSRYLLVVAVPYQVYVLTESSLLVGLVGLVQIAPLILGAILGGAAADAVDRRRLLIGVELVLSATAAGFALNSGPEAPLWPIYVLIAVNAAAMGVEGPSRMAMIPSLVGPGELPSAFALNQTLHQTGQVVGPALAGLIIARWGLGAAYWLAAASGLLTAMMVAPLGDQRPEGATGRMTLGAIAEGWRYLRSVPLLQQTMLIDLNAMVFGLPRALFPAIGTTVLGGDASTVGLLHAAPGAGALLAALTTGWVSRVRYQGRAVVLSVCCWGLAIAAFGLVRDLVPAMIALGMAGASDVVSNVFRNTILQAEVPDGLRGRVTAFKGALSGGGPPLGDAEAGALAALTSPSVSVVSGGLASLAGALLIGWRGRAIWNQTAAVTPAGGPRTPPATGSEPPSP
jgi:Transmembrane secretion effector